MRTTRASARSQVPPVLLAMADQRDVRHVREVLVDGGLANPVRDVSTASAATAYLAAAGTRRPKHPPPAVVVTGLHLASGTAYDVLRATRDHLVLRRIPVVVVGDRATDDEIDLVHRLGATAYLARPALGRTLVDVVRGIGLPWSLAPMAGNA